MSLAGLADAVLLVHLGVVTFVIGGLVLVVAGNLAGWRWVNGLAFRAAHLAAIGFVVVQAWLGATCPLTLLEAWLRNGSASSSAGQGFIAHWAQRILFYEAPTWAFTLAYTAFGLAVAAAWWAYPPRHRNASRRATGPLGGPGRPAP